MYRLTFFFAIGFLLLLTSCQSDFIEDAPPDISDDDIESELIPYFEEFKEKASEHGIEVDYESSNVTAKIELIDESSVAGTCSTNGHNIRDIVIDRAFWNRAPELLREMIVFHELGHCVLGRGHREDAFGNGVCRSIMRSGLGDCRDAYNAQNRAYFIEELFVEAE